MTQIDTKKKRKTPRRRRTTGRTIRTANEWIKNEEQKKKFDKWFSQAYNEKYAYVIANKALKKTLLSNCKLIFESRRNWSTNNDDITRVELLLLSFMQTLSSWIYHSIAYFLVCCSSWTKDMLSIVRRKIEYATILLLLDIKRKSSNRRRKHFFFSFFSLSLLLLLLWSI